ncbi:electron transfer flavoprotein subunit beta/FixA family protein [Marinilongibacter aquaticus]|uniref:electron transfer flavoprotein subunit beta/FixA family protein n=1 Tax=Marinilongibacter aquaticus TaxID=2975157 RepID=UPI0021BD9342|nr:electron transfer flavoprotein subunit beta/FixA family protein [Marinilongibacter aquaticus]UBM58494.1 electron transfer flavoprotein subunit beta/FixA family protein [Marinilongibacter aquaticus]
MKILVCISSVPDTTAKISFVDNDTAFDKSSVTQIIGPYDDYALARAVELKEQVGGSVTVLNVGLSDTEPQIRKALAIGADDAVRIDAEPSDSYFVAEQIANYAKDKSFDLIMMGRETTDYNSGVVHGIVGQMLNIPSLSPVMELELDGNKAKISREIEGGKEKIEAALPLVLGCQEPIAEWKIANMRGIMSARKKPLEVLAPLGEALSQVDKYELPPAKGDCKIIPAEEAEKLIELLRNEAKVI